MRAQARIQVCSSEYFFSHGHIKWSADGNNRQHSFFHFNAFSSGVIKGDIRKESVLKITRTSVVNAIKVYFGLLLLAFLVSQTPSYAAEPPKDRLADHIASVCQTGCVDSGLLKMALRSVRDTQHVDPLLMVAVIQKESNFRHRALNTQNGRSVGLAQIQVRWHRDKFDSHDYYDVFQNLRVGGEILQACQKKYRNARSALWCYNGHQKHGQVLYADKVLKTYYLLKEKQVLV